MTAAFTVVIPARFGATRLPGKPLEAIRGKPLVQWVWESASASAAAHVYIATDHDGISEAGHAFGADVVMTSSSHASGTDRIAEVARKLKLPDDAIVINVQGDEFGLTPALIDQVAEALHAHPEREMATLGARFRDRNEWLDPHVVKVIVDANGDAIYFSRAPIPWQDGMDVPSLPLRHMGLYAYRAGLLRRFTVLKPTELELSERLEQLRALHYGFKIRVEVACAPAGIGVDTHEDLERARRMKG
ncbi:MAG: 3-deoxy-manno-octulosonate cytidylyltransferase [Gammaproteobacteria bacterium]|nr:3-deoxy-manno-octulosonate cytidylyltransferase [Gammaproteobacteria bacterium]